MTGFWGVRPGTSIFFQEGPAREKIAPMKPVRAISDMKRRCPELPFTNRNLSSFLSQTFTQEDRLRPLPEKRV